MTKIFQKNKRTMKKTLIILSAFAFISSSYGRATSKEKNVNSTNTLLKVLKIDDVSQLPKGITYKGEFKDGIRYFDKSGEHIVIITETGEYRRNEYGNDAELFAYNFAVNEDNTIKQIWKVYDFYQECPVDIAANFVENTFQITDLNNDGIAEIWLVYIIGCKGDVSPWDMKIIMYEGNQKFAMRGKQKNVAEEWIFGGEYKFDSAFDNGAKVFRDFAKKLWNENGVVYYNVTRKRWTVRADSDRKLRLKVKRNLTD
jgi:hypothetical protein